MAARDCCHTSQGLSVAMKYDLSAMVKQTRKTRRKVIALRKVIIPSTLASDLYISAYKPIVDVWRGGVGEIMSAYTQTLSEIVQDSPQDVSMSVSAVEAKATSIIIATRARLERWAENIERLHRRRWAAAVKAATGLDIGMMIGPADVRTTLGAVIEQNVALVKSVSDQTRQRIAQEVFDGLRTNKAPREVAKALGEKVAMGRRRALNIASDQSNKLASALDAERRRQAGIMAWQWIHSGKLHPREDHVARNGKLYSDDPADVGLVDGGKRVGKSPGDRPGELPFCGCSSRAVLLL